jgi:hypothetical protein
MKLLRTVVSSLLPVGLLVLQLSCGGDASGPGGHVATSITANSSTTLTGPPGTQVTELPSVLIRDESGAPMVGASVIFTVASGAGSVTGGSTTTNPSGIATVGSWTLGAVSGANTLVATSGNLPSVTFTANGFDPCATAATHTLGSTTTGELALTDCKLGDGSFVDFYAVTIPTSGTYVFDQTSTAFDTYLALLTFTGTVIGVNDDLSPTVPDSRLKAIVPAGTYIIGANSFLANKVGNYSLVSAASATPVTNCEDVFVLPGITSLQGVQTTDCITNGFFSDEYVIFLTAGQTITVSMTSSAVDSYLEIRADGSAAVLVSNDDIDGTTNARVTYTVPVLQTPTTGFYIIAAASRVAGVTGDYTLVIQ